MRRFDSADSRTFIAIRPRFHFVNEAVDSIYVYRAAAIYGFTPRHGSMLAIASIRYQISWATMMVA